ncbi:hypothetical protein TWF718_007208 [Orbilia javanica]|uniref:Uncharacterized protein n=1 Tax=Orbilia javanica TaxID=47235 RepID=A0AAN8N2I4_9PEZI
MRYNYSLLPACVVLAHLAGTTLALPVPDDCPYDDSPSLVKRDAEAHVSMPHIVANFEPQPSASPSPPSEGETHRLQKRADRFGSFKKVFGKLTNKLCGTGEARREAAENSVLRQSNAGVSQQDVIAPEGLDDVIPAAIDLGENNQQDNNQAPNNQGQNTEVIVEEEKEEDFEDVDSPPVNRRRRQSIRTRPGRNTNRKEDVGVSRFGTEENIRDMISRLPENPAPVRIQDTPLFQQRVRNLNPIPELPLGESIDSLPRGSIQLGESEVLPQGSIRSGQGSGASGTEVGDPNELRISLSESFNPFIPKDYRKAMGWDKNDAASPELSFSDDGADEVASGQNGINIQPQNNQNEDQMRAGKLPNFMKKLALDYGVPYAAEKLLGVDISPYTEHPGVLDYLRGRRGKNVVVVDDNAPKEKKPGFFRRLLNRKGRYQEPVKVINTGPAEPRIGYNGPVNVQPGWVLDPADTLSRKVAQDREDANREAELGVETVRRQNAQRQSLIDRNQLDKTEQARRAALYDQLYPNGDEGEEYVPNDQEEFRIVVEEPGNNNAEESVDMLERAQIFTEDLSQPQIRRNRPSQSEIALGPSNQEENPAGGNDIQLGSPVPSNVADQDAEDINVSFGEGNERLFGEDTADFAGNLRESAQSQGWNLGVSRISAFPQVQAAGGAGGGVEYPQYIEGESREEDDYIDLAESGPEQIRTEIVNEQISDIQPDGSNSVQTLQSSVATIADPNFSFANPNLGGSISSGGSQGQGSQIRGQPPQ